MSIERIQEARRLHVGGDLAAAISAYAALLADDPAQAEVWHLKGVAEHQAGQLDRAHESARKAIALGGERPAFLMLEGGVLHDRGDLAAAEERFARVVAAQPGSPAAHVELGRVRLDQGRASEALESFRAAASADPSHVRAWNNIGIALQSLDRLDEAARAFGHAISIKPDYALAHFNVARIERTRGDLKKALEHANLAVTLDPALSAAWLIVGDIQRHNRQSGPALEAYLNAIRAAPQDAAARIALAELLAETGRHDEAKREFRRVAEVFPQNLRASLGAQLLLPQVYSSLEHLAATRRDYAAGLEQLHADAATFRFERPERALEDMRWTNFYLAYQGYNDVALQKRFGEFHRRMLEPALPRFFEPRARRSARERIRVGFLSHFFFNCTAGRYFSSWITHLDKSRFEPYVYYTNEWVADDTRTIAAAAHAFRHLPGRPLETIARQVIADDLDVLVYPELGMHAETFTLAGLRLAPVQCAGWGHPNTTGLAEIDWFISCEPMEPADAQTHYSERLALLPGLGTRYAIPKAEGEGTRADFGIPDDRTVYLVPQSLFKIHPDNDELIAQVLERDPRGIALFFASHHEALTSAFAVRMSQAFTRHKLDFYDRASFLMPFIPHPTYLRLNALCDVMLDTLHWSGGNTSLDALSSGLPVVTLPGGLMRGRQSQAMLRALGVDELVASDVEGYVRTAVRLGKDKEERDALAERMKSNGAALFERDEPIRALEAFLERAAGGANAA